MAKLTAMRVRNAKHPGQPARPMRIGDGGGLYLQVAVAGTKSWLFRYTMAGRAREMGLGPAGDGKDVVPLATARVAAAAARTQAQNGVDPIEHRDSAKRAAGAVQAKARANTFRTVTEEYVASHAAGWRNAKHAAQWSSTLNAYAYPHMGEMPVSVVDAEAVLAALRPIWAAKPETASRVRGRMEAVLDYAAARGLREGVNPARWRGHLAKLLPAPRKVRRVRHHPALPWQDVGGFLAALRGRDGVAARALELAILTAARSGEVRGMRWREVDMDAGTWTVPAERMKAGREHRVALSGPALDVLRGIELLSTGPDGFVFPGARAGKPLSVMALDMVLRRMNPEPKKGEALRWQDRHGEGITAHGFRSTFRDWTGEATAHPREVAEAALAHVVGGVEGAYARGDLLERRRVLMEEWATWCARPATPSKVLPLRRTA